MNARDDLEDAAREVLHAADACRDAVNGQGHPGEPHDRMLHHLLNGPLLPGEVQVFSTVDDCSACGGAQYGTEDTLMRAYARLRVALGEEPLPWETVA